MLKSTFASPALLMAAGSASAQTMDHSRMDHGAHMGTMHSGQRQADVAQRGKEVMPFSLAATMAQSDCCSELAKCCLEMLGCCD